MSRVVRMHQMLTHHASDVRVIEWLTQVDEDEVFLSVVTFAELRHGIERLPASRRRRHLDAWLRSELPHRFEGRIALVDGAIADEWGRPVARHEAPPFIRHGALDQGDPPLDRQRTRT